jgi:hypothetical protein
MTTTNIPNPQALITQIVDFYSQYLSCSPDQLDLLALWTLHSRSLPAAPFSPSLNIHSRHKQSGKSLCLQLLSLLCEDPWLHTAPTPSLLLQQLTNDKDGENAFTGTLLVDDCHATFGKRMNLKLRGLLTESFKQDGRFIVRFKDDDGYAFDRVHVFIPTAFAGDGRLPACLADLSIPIALEPKRPVLRCQPKEPGSACKPFRFYAAQQLAKPLRASLSNWGADTDKLFSEMAPYNDDQFPPELSFRQRDCAEPLLQIADFIGGEWPQRARQALVNAFALAAFEDFYSSRQILSDLREAFAEKGNPGWISTADLLAFLHTLDDRAWDEWNKGKPLQPKALACLLEPFGIRPRNHRTSPDTVVKGYHLEDFHKSWTLYLPLRSAVAADRQSPLTASSGQELGAGSQKLVAAEFTNPEIPNAPRSGVAADQQDSSNGHLRPELGSQKPTAPRSGVAPQSNNSFIGPLRRVAARNLRSATST